MTATVPAPSDGTLRANFSANRTDFTIQFDLQVSSGQTLALMGPSGAGKTTVLDALAGLSRIDSGQITLGSEILARTETLAGTAAKSVHVPPSRRRVGLLRQDGDLFPHLSAVDNIAFAIKVRGVTTVAAKQEASDWLERIGLLNLGARFPDELSGGEARRIALLRALAAKPRLLLIDEPFASLDVEAAADMRTLITEQLREHPTTTIVVSHDARDALSLADHVAILQEGTIVQHGQVHEVLAAPKTRFVQALAEAAGPMH